MLAAYVHHRVTTRPRAWQEVAQAIDSEARARIEAAGGRLYGIWRSQIGRPRDELTVITVWPSIDGTATMQETLSRLSHVERHSSRSLAPTLRPTTPEPPVRQGNYAFRWFDTPRGHWDEFLALCAAAWPGFETHYDSQVVGLWQTVGNTSDTVRSLLLTRRPDLAMWERSKLPQGDEEAEVRDKLSRRYDLCDATVVYTSTLLTAADRRDTARWT